MIVKIRKWGNSLAMRFPSTIAKNLDLKDGTEMKIDVSPTGDRCLLLEPSLPTLADLVAKITPENRPKQVDWGNPVGKEVW